MRLLTATISVLALALPSGAGAASGNLNGLLTPSGGFTARPDPGPGASFRAGAATESITPPPHGHAPGGDPADCDRGGAFGGPRRFAFEEPYTDLKHDGHYDPGDPFKDCNGNGRWDGNLLGGGAENPRFYDHVADPVSARAMVIASGRKRIAVEVLDQEGLFDVYQDRIRARVRADGYRLNGVFISATHDESAPDSLGLGGVTQTTSGVSAYWTDYMVRRSARAIERAYRALRPARIRYTEVLEPSNLRQCWSSYPYVDDQRMPVLEAVTPSGRAIVTLASVSQHAETLGFNGGTPALDAQRRWISADWTNFFRTSVQRRLGGVAIEMAGAVGSVESPEVYAHAISRTPQQFVDASHPAGCRTLFRVGAGTDAAGRAHVPLGYDGETKAFGQALAAPVIGALTRGRYHLSATNTLWGARANICVPLANALFGLGASLGVFAVRPGYNANCTKATPVARSGASAGQALRSEVAAFEIGDGEFVSIPGEVFPFTYLRGFLGPQDMPAPGAPLPPWLIPHLHAPYRFIDGLAEDMIGYMFPRGNAVGIPTLSNLSPSDTDRFGCSHSDDAEAVSADSADLAGRALVALLDRHGGAPETIVPGRYVLPGGATSRDPLGTPELKCSLDIRFTAARRGAVAVQLASGRRVRPRAWMSLSGLPERAPDRDTRGYFDARGRRVWLDVFR
ncbi:MAG: hypothetical protein JO153_03610 [Solirubrobacterales bacterium]|nr:hypothetical protein [Solirubrobacterales bacterium]